MESIHRRLYRKEFERLGPSVLRVAEDYLQGYINLRDHPNRRIRAKAEYYGKNAHYVMMLIPASKRYVSPQVADWLDGLYQRLEEATGPMTMKEQLVSKGAPALLALEALKLRLGIDQQPVSSRRTFRAEKPAIFQDLTRMLRKLSRSP
ncbi:MAG: hypothetical protein GXP54_11535 [Deltaproteobacteria bacterium]|nr:hypothetical protein [Deltaproteobacteria bacterium]